MRSGRELTFVAILVASVLATAASGAHAQIKQPGKHPSYDVEVEPHLFLQLESGGWFNDTGIGVGGRVTIPLMHNGPIDSINNNMGIGFGLDWAHFDNACYYGVNIRGIPNNWAYGDCPMNDFWLPIVWQWSFYFTPLISAFVEPGLAIEHTSWSSDLCPGGIDCSYNDTSLEFVFWLGVRFHLSDDFALVLRLGTPSLDFGPAFLM